MTDYKVSRGGKVKLDCDDTLRYCACTGAELEPAPIYGFSSRIVRLEDDE